MGIFVKILGGLLLLYAVISSAFGRKLINPPGCGAVPEQGLIVRDHAPLQSNPWLARIIYVGKMFDSFRLGALINHRYVLTTASGMIGPIFFVRLGEKNVFSDPDCEWKDGILICAAPFQDFEVQEYIRHPEFDKQNFENDFALLRLMQDVVYSERVHPICICRDLEASTLQIATYVERPTMRFPGVYSEIQRQTSEVEIIPSLNCKDVYPEITEKNHVCTNYNSTYEKHDIGSPFIQYKGDGSKRYCLASLLKTEDFVNNNPSELLAGQFNWLENSMME